MATLLETEGARERGWFIHCRSSTCVVCKLLEMLGEALPVDVNDPPVTEGGACKGDSLSEKDTPRKELWPSALSSSLPMLEAVSAMDSNRTVLQVALKKGMNGM